MYHKSAITSKATIIIRVIHRQDSIEFSYINGTKIPIHSASFTRDITQFYGLLYKLARK